MPGVLRERVGKGHDKSGEKCAVEENIVAREEKRLNVYRTDKNGHRHQMQPIRHLSSLSSSEAAKLLFVISSFNLRSLPINSQQFRKLQMSRTLSTSISPRGTSNRERYHHGLTRYQRYTITLQIIRLLT